MPALVSPCICAQEFHLGNATIFRKAVLIKNIFVGESIKSSVKLHDLRIANLTTEIH